MVKVSALQYAMSKDVNENLKKAKEYIIKACEDGADVILPSELFENWYFCQERSYESYDLAVDIKDNKAVLMALEISGQYNVVIPVSVYERAGYNTFNTVVMVDSGKILGIYRKTHIPDDHYYQEKFYFTPGDTGFKVWDTSKGKIGVGICWDQWFPECARSMALLGAQLLLYPTAIGSEPILDVDSMPHWRRVMQGHAAANLMPVIAANRVGVETVTPNKENGGQSSSLKFYGSSFMTDETGDIVVSAGREEETVISYEYDLEAIDKQRLSWGLFRDRRPECYGMITSRI